MHPPVDLLRAIRFFNWKIVEEARALQVAVETQLAKASTVDGDPDEGVGEALGLKDIDWKSWGAAITTLRTIGDDAMRRVQLLNDFFPLCDDAPGEAAGTRARIDFDLRYIKRVIEAGDEATPQDRRAAKECVKTLLLHNRKAFG